jgi:LPXTG-motif cell wall-anchored protein
MKAVRVYILVITILAVLMLPMVVSAAGTFYCSALKSSGGTGTYGDPWACSTEQQLNDVIYNKVCAYYGGGNLFRIDNGFYDYYKIVKTADGGCAITVQVRYSGYPPNTGINLSMPMALGLAAGAGALLLVGGLALRRRRQAA